MNFHNKKVGVLKLLLRIILLIILVSINNQAQALEKERAKLKTLETAVYYDKDTGLEWFVGPDHDTNWKEAKKWVENLNVDSDGWRMPTIKELNTLYKEGIGERNMTSLLKTTGWFVWSGEVKDSSSAWYLYFRNDVDFWCNQGISYNKRVFAVRFRR